MVYYESELVLVLLLLFSIPFFSLASTHFSSASLCVYAGRRNLPGSLQAELFTWKLEEKFEDMQGQFATQEYIQYLIRMC